jgi:hypothetical protein
MSDMEVAQIHKLGLDYFGQQVSVKKILYCNLKKINNNYKKLNIWFPLRMFFGIYISI